MDTPLSKDLEDKLGSGQKLEENDATVVRRAIARINFMAQDRPDLAAVSRILSSCMANPFEGARVGIKRVIRYLKKYSRCWNVLKWNEEVFNVKVYTDSDWAGERTSRKSTSGGFLQVGAHTLCHWSKLQSTVALSSGEAELNAAVKGISEMIGVYKLVKGLIYKAVPMKVMIDASACKGMLLRHGVGKVNHLTTKQLWCQGAVEVYGIKVVKIPRCQSGGDMMTHLTTGREMELNLEQTNCCRI